MPLYLVKFSYTPEAWSRLIQSPEDRRVVARESLEAIGATLHNFWYGFGEHDGYAVIDAPDNVSIGAVAAAWAGGGALKSVETTVLMTVEELMESLRRAQGVAYRPPGT